MSNLYDGRYLSERYPDLEKLGVEYFKQHQRTETCISEIMASINRLIDTSSGLNTDSETINKSVLRKFFLNKVRYNPWFRALSLT